MSLSLHSVNIDHRGVEQAIAVEEMGFKAVLVLL
jgi:hypothetical protein